MAAITSCSDFGAKKKYINKKKMFLEKERNKLTSCSVSTLGPSAKAKEVALYILTTGMDK